MKRREFIGKTGCGVAGIFAARYGLESLEKEGGAVLQHRRRYKIEVEIYEVGEGVRCHKKGDKFSYPDDMGKICSWLRGSMHDFITCLDQGVTLSWKYEGTPYEKVIDPDGITTEYVRCPDPTANLVAKITRTKI
jgi:uncharacterized repeat protein (TIGR04076 family)